MSFVQFNLLPDIKLEFDRIQKAKRFVFTVSILVTAFVMALFIISFVTVNILQKKLLSDANNDINHYSQQLKSIPDIEKILTIQNQLYSLPALHQKKHVVSRLLTYLPQVTPTKVNIGKLELDTSTNSIEITGTADAVETINQFVDTLKFTSFTTNNDQGSKNLAFSNVVLNKVDRNDKTASYTIDANYDPALFDATQTITLIVPQEITTRSVIGAPGPLFDGQTGKPQNQQKQTQGGQ